MVTILNKMIRGKFVEKIVLEQRPGGGEGASHEIYLGKI